MDENRKPPRNQGSKAKNSNGIQARDLEFHSSEDLITELISRKGNDEEVVDVLMKLLKEHVDGVVANVVVGSQEGLYVLGSPSVTRGLGIVLLEHINLLYLQSRGVT